jgi:Zn-dependent protease/CBS domain-containing protein
MFGKRFKLFKLLGFEVSIDLSWVIIAVLVAWSLSTGLFPFQVRDLSTGTYWMMGIFGALGLFMSIIVHEFSHSIVARRGGVQMKGITLFIFGGVAEMGNEPADPQLEFSVAIVGPLTSIAMGAIFYGLYVLGSGGGWPVPVTSVLGYLSLINFLLAAFNLIPAYPLDGGRILRSILWGWKKNLRWATRISANVGSGFGMVLIALGVIRILGGNFIGGMWMSLIGWFITSAAKMSYQQLVTRRALEGETVNRFMKRQPVTVPRSVTVEKLVEDFIYRHHYKFFPVTDNGTLLGCVSTRDVKQTPRDQWERLTVGDIAADCASDNTISPDADALEALSAMRRNNASRLMVVEKDRLIGIIALKDMLEFLSLKVELDE